MTGFTLSNKAKADLRQIATFTERRWGKEQRNLYLKQLDEAFHLLAERPQAGRTCDDIKPGYRKFPQGNHLIFYRAGTQAAIHVVRILHETMDVETHL